MSRIEKRLTLVPIFFFKTNICPDPVPKEMESCEISSQLKKISFLIGNEMRWDRIYQSHSHPVYASEIKKYFTLVPKFFYGTKIRLNSVPNGMRSYRIPSRPKWRIPSNQEKLSSLLATPNIGSIHSQHRFEGRQPRDSSESKPSSSSSPSSHFTITGSSQTIALLQPSRLPPVLLLVPIIDGSVITTFRQVQYLWSRIRLCLVSETSSFQLIVALFEQLILVCYILKL